MSAQFLELCKTLEISNDRFIRTTDPNHAKRAQAIWQKLAPYIYKAPYVGWYCTGDEEFFPEVIVKANNGICPDHNRPYEKVEEENYFLKLSALAPKIKAAIEKDEYRVVPAARKNEILSLINVGLEDVSISRPKDKIGWGIPVPGDSNHTMYVWFEALLNYITVLGYPEHADFKKFWPADVHVIGKGVLRFHAAIWPGILLGLGLPLPKTLYAHGYVTINQGKMSKTLGNVVNPGEIIERYGSETFRYFFLRHMPSYSDGDFTWERLDAAYNDELADQLGNAVSRVAAMVTNYQNGLIGDMPDPEHDTAQYHEAVNDCRFDRALDEVWEQVRGLNQYIDEAKPWQIAKSADTIHLQEVLAYCSTCLVEIANLLTPFMPATAAKINDTFASGSIKPLGGPLFPKAQKTK
jgi:methionyl-tRNA synthetase